MDLKISEMMQMQVELYQRNASKWSPLEPGYGKNTILYMVEEIGEVISILKKKGDYSVVNDTFVREAFLEEMADVLMYYTDILLRYQITADDISQAYVRKHTKNIERDFTKEYKEKYNG